MIEGTTMKDTRPPLAEPGAVRPTPNQPTPEPQPVPSTVGAVHCSHFVAPGAVLRAGVARRAAAEFLRW